MKATHILPVILVFGLACSTYSIKKDVNEVSSFKNAKKVGVIVRCPQNSRVSRDGILSNLSRSLNGFHQLTSIEIIPDLSTQMIDYSNDEERIYQSTGDSDYLKYKSIGFLKTYLRSNSDEIKKAFEKNSLDGIIIYETYTIISIEMQMMKFNSVIALVGKDSSIIYLDHQDNVFESKESDLAALQREMLNHISKRFLDKMKDFDYIKEL
jgi:hypothetical protein